MTMILLALVKLFGFDAVSFEDHNWLDPLFPKKFFIDNTS